MTPLRVLVVDDAALFRKIISETLASVPDVEVVGTASNGSIALARIAALKPDLVLLDIEMPEMNGIEVLQAIRKQGIEVGVIIISAFTRSGSEMTIRALELGAFDFITKATVGSAEQNRDSIRADLVRMVKTFSRRHEIRSILKGDRSPAGGIPTRPAPVSSQKPAGASENVIERMEKLSGWTRPSMVLLGISTGGPNALSKMLPRIPNTLGVPIFIVQHMPPLFTQSLAASLNDRCSLSVKEAEHGETARPNVVYIAPGGKHMKINPGPSGEIQIEISNDPPENNCKPAVDTLFRSAAHGFAGRACAVIMTGMGSDGTLGLRLLKRHGCRTIAQDEASCVVFGMPKEAIDAGVIDVVAPLDSIADEITKAVKGYAPV
jgi:two-component system, chemotaxis family, protein-glutamate methylesterase/glutaminase